MEQENLSCQAVRCKKTWGYRAQLSQDQYLEAELEAN